MQMDGSAGFTPAPHAPWPHPSLVPHRDAVSRRASASDAPGSTRSVRGQPFSVMRTSTGTSASSDDGATASDGGSADACSMACQSDADCANMPNLPACRLGACESGCCTVVLDLDGTIYQTLDLKERAWHATTSNTRSIGIEIANIGAFAPGQQRMFEDWYQRDDTGWPRVVVPARLGAPPEITKIVLVAG